MEPFKDQDLEIKEHSLGKKFLVFIGIMFVCTLIGNLILIGFAILGGMEISSGLDVFSAVSDPVLKPFIKAGIGFNHFFMFTVSAILFALWIKKRSWLKYFDRDHIDIDMLFKMITLLFLSYPLIALSAMLLEGIDLPEWMNTMDEESMEALMKMLHMDGFGDLMVNLVIIAILPAIGEELLFRGIIQKELTKIITNPHVAILLASVVFSGFHLQIQGFIPKVIIGLVLGYAYYWTKSIWYPMIIHFLNNGLQTLMLFFAGDKMEELEKSTDDPEIITFVLVAIISSFLCYLLIKNILKHIEPNQKNNT